MTRERTATNLIARARAGEEAAREELLQHLERPLYDYFIARTRHRQASEDLLQNTLIKVLTRLPQLRQDGSFQGWVYAIARSELLDRAKSKKERHGELDPERFPAGRTPLEELLEGEEDRQLAQAIDDLPPRQREVVLLRVRQELPFVEIAALLEISEENARVTFHQAVAQLRSRLQEPPEAPWTAVGKTATTPF